MEKIKSFTLSSYTPLLFPIAFSCATLFTGAHGPAKPAVKLSSEILSSPDPASSLKWLVQIQSKEVLIQHLDLYLKNSRIFVKQSHNINGLSRTFWTSYFRLLVTVSKSTLPIDTSPAGFLGYTNHNAQSCSPFQLYHYHRSLYCLWTGLLCCHCCCWSYCCGRVVWKMGKIITLPDEVWGERVWVLSHGLALHSWC